MEKYVRKKWSEECPCGNPQGPMEGEGYKGGIEENICEGCDKKECTCRECKMTETDKNSCELRGQDYSARADMCHKPCEKGKIFDPKKRTCISNV